MTLPSRKKHPTTARRSIKQAIADRSQRARRSLARLLRWSLCIPVGSLCLTAGWLDLKPASAQNPLRSSPEIKSNELIKQPAWSPSPFQANPLREDVSASRAFETNREASASQNASSRTLSTIAKNAIRSTGTVAESSNQSQTLRWRKVEVPAAMPRQPIASKQASQAAVPQVVTAAFEDQATKQPPRSSLLVQQPSEPTPTLTLPPATQPPALTLPPAAQPPAVNLPPASAQPQALNLPPAAQLPITPPPVAKPPITQPPATESLGTKPLATEPLEPMPESVLPNPFPKPTSPSDRKLREPANLGEQDDLKEPSKLDDDLPPAPPKRADQSVANCDLVRDFAAGADIRNFQLDSSPDFVQGYQSGNRPGSLTQETFVKKSPIRTWRGSQGEFIAEGKLVDLIYGTVVIEQADGKRVSYLQRKLSDGDQVFVSEAWGIPVTCPLGDQGFAPRLFVDSTLTWKASGACNKPLYFEDVSLERYGHEWGPVVQPVVSTVRFFGDLAVLPYKMGIHPPNECQHPLGYHRPGSCAPWSIRPVPISMRGAATQAAFVTGTVFTLP